MTEHTKQIRFDKTLAALEGAMLRERCPLNGKITSITVSFRAGCNQLVDVAFGVEERHIIPDTGYIALEDTTPTFPTSEPVKMNDRLWAEIKNGDSGNAHRITVLATIVGEFGDKNGD